MGDPSESNGTLYMETVHAFLSVYRYLRRYSHQMHGLGISGRKVAALRYLLAAGPRTIGQLREYLYISCSTTSELVNRLEGKGYVTRARSPEDNRVVIVSLTQTGRDIAQQTTLGGFPLLREKLKALPDERLRRIKEALIEVKQLLEIDA